MHETTAGEEEEPANQTLTPTVMHTQRERQKDSQRFMRRTELDVMHAQDTKSDTKGRTG